MNDLYIVRHGIAVDPGTPGMADDERPLTSKGEKRMRQVARGLSKLELKLDRIVTSPLPRARARRPRSWPTPLMLVRGWRPRTCLWPARPLWRSRGGCASGPRTA